MRLRILYCRFSLVELVNERTGTSVLLEGMEAKEYAELSEEEVRLTGRPPRGLVVTPAGPAHFHL